MTARRWEKLTNRSRGSSIKIILRYYTSVWFALINFVARTGKPQHENLWWWFCGSRSSAREKPLSRKKYRILLIVLPVNVIPLGFAFDEKRIFVIKSYQANGKIYLGIESVGIDTLTHLGLGLRDACKMDLFVTFSRLFIVNSRITKVFSSRINK